MSNILDLCKKFYIIANLNSRGGKTHYNDLHNLISKFRHVGLSIGYNEHILTSRKVHPFWKDLDAQYEESLSYDGIIVLGGDGTKTYILNKLISEKINKPFIGISSGTMNVGYATAFGIDDEIPVHLKEVSLDAVVTFCDDNYNKAYSFLESVIGDTFVTTCDNSITQVSVKRFLQTGDKVRTLPKLIGNSSTSIYVNRKDNEKKICLPPFSQIATIAVAPLVKELRARVMAGGANPSACIGIPGGLIVTDFPLTWADVTENEIFETSPISSSFFPLNYDDEVIVSGIKEGFLVSDGNAVRRIDNISFRLVRDVYKIYK